MSAIMLSIDIRPITDERTFYPKVRCKNSCNWSHGIKVKFSQGKHRYWKKVLSNIQHLLKPITCNDIQCHRLLIINVFYQSNWLKSCPLYCSNNGRKVDNNAWNISILNITGVERLTLPIRKVQGAQTHCFKSNFVMITMKMIRYEPHLKFCH